MNVIYKILIAVGLGIVLWRGGYEMGLMRSQTERAKADTVAITEREIQHDKIHNRVVAVSRDDNVCWLCKNYAAHDNKTDVPADVALSSISANGRP